MTRDAIVSELVSTWGWSPQTLHVWERAGFRCEYCDAELLRSVDDYFYGSQLDHIMPHSKQGSIDNLNLALSCRACNALKRDRVFEAAAGPEPRLALPEIRRFITRRRADKKAALARITELSLQLRGLSADSDRPCGQ